MSTISNSIFTLLSGDSALTALVGARIIPTVAKAGTEIPYLVFQRISHVTEKAHDGSALHSYRYQFTAVSTSQPETEQIRDALIDLLDGYDDTLDGERVTVAHDSDIDEHDEEADLHTTIADFNFTRQN